MLTSTLRDAPFPRIPSTCAGCASRAGEADGRPGAGFVRTVARLVGAAALLVVGFAGSAGFAAPLVAQSDTARSDAVRSDTVPPLLQRYTPVTDEALVDPRDGDWVMWRRTYDQQAHSPLDRIDTTNVSELRLAWAWTLDPGRQEATPLVHDGVMFVVQGCDVVDALDARHGTLLWQYQRPVVDHPAAHACANRNAALYEDRIVLGTHDAHLVALDVRTGEPVWEERVGDWTVGHHYSGGPQVIDGKVVAGMSGCYHINGSCWISAHDPETGEELWRTRTLAQPGDPASASWGDVPPDRRWGGASWNAPGYDPELNLIYAGVGVPVPWGSEQRGSGDHSLLYTNSTLALDPGTGEIRWHFQHLPGDEWDQDHTFERILVETEVAPDPDAVEWLSPDIRPGERRKVVTGLPGKPGLVWTLDAETGEFLWARTTSFQNVLVGVDAENRRGVPNPEIEPHIGEDVLVCPYLAAGSINWQAVAYSPDTHALYAPTNDTCMNYTLTPVEPQPGEYHGSARYVPVLPPGSDGDVGRFTAVDVATGRTLWEHRQRAGIGGSVLSTGGGLVFVSDDARRFRAFDARTGEILWERVLNSTAGGFPVTYLVDGVQYVAIAAGGGVTYRSLTPEIRQRRGGNVLYVFRLPS